MSGGNFENKTINDKVNIYIYTLNITRAWFLSKNNEGLTYIREDN